jgi:hypothetical protein
MGRKYTAESARTRFAALLAGHLAKGTRPVTAAGAPWSYAEFAAEVPSSRANDDFVSPRSVSNWCKGGSLPAEIDPVLRALFGPTSSGRHADAREELLEAFRAARAEKNAAVIARTKPDPAGGTWDVPDNEKNTVLTRTAPLHNVRPEERRSGIPTHLSSLGRDLKRQWDQLHQGGTRDRDFQSIIVGRVHVADDLIRQLVKVTNKIVTTLPESCVLIARGGYGCGVLSLGSDIDVTFVHNDNNKVEAEYYYRSFSLALQDVWRLTKSIRAAPLINTVGECVEAWQKAL